MNNNLKISISATKTEHGYNPLTLINGKTIAGAPGKPDIRLEISQSDNDARHLYDDIFYDSYKIQGNQHVFTKKLEAPSFIAYITVETVYEIINSSLIRKTVSLTQRNAPQIYYNLINDLFPAMPITRKFAFDEWEVTASTDMKYQRFPALGFAYDNLHLGMISENGFYNKYPRNNRKRKVAKNYNYDAFEPVKNCADPDFMGFAQVQDADCASFNIGAYIDNNGERKHYNIMHLGRTETKTFYIFACEARNIRDIKLEVQESYADGRGFVGTQAEKVLYACAMINLTIAEIGDFSPHSVPAPIGYSPDMYNRDTFWTINALDDKYLNETLCRRFWDTQDETGCIGTIITPVTGSIEVKDNDSTILMFLWHYRNQKRFGSDNIPKEMVDRAYEYCLNALDKNREGRCTAHFALSQQDISYYPDGTQLSVNQGMFAVFLRCAMLMGYPISEEYLSLAEEAYREYYDEADRCLRLFDGDDYTNSFDNLVPEFLSIWLFGHKILTDNQVSDMIESYPASNITHAKALFVKRNGDNLTIDEWPFKKNEYNQPGTYYNGGSWLRGEVMAYAAAYYHGYKEAREMIKNRLQAELDRYPDDPVSHEFLPTDISYPYDSWIRNNSVFSWNIFALEAEKLVGLR
ncbi:MAG: hypothetical protein FWE11_01575 [Defluviitaleaceae bacterium]|nr:hypothetical protein [Defluviitaleaceae bacterium]